MARPLLALGLVISWLAVLAHQVVDFQANTTQPNYSSPSRDDVPFNVAVKLCSDRGTGMAFINASLPADKDPVKEVFEQSYSSKDTFNLWLAVVYGAPEDIWNYVFLPLTSNYETDRNKVIDAIKTFYRRGSTHDDPYKVAKVFCVTCDYLCDGGTYDKVLDVCTCGLVKGGN